MRIITISREFGSGGRELGKRMADLIGFAYYDKEIIEAIAATNKMDEAYVSEVMEKGMSRSFPITVGRTFTYPAFVQRNETKILVSQQKIVKELATRGDCIVMGQGADIILREHYTLNLFVYADMASKIGRCKERTSADENLSDSELKKRIKQVDAGRSNRYDLLSNSRWGAKENYHLCINTTGVQIKTLAPQIAGYAEYWFGQEEL